FDSTRLATTPPSFPACSIHQTPSDGIWKSASFWKLIQARTTAAVVNRISSPAVKRIWKSRFIDRNGSWLRAGEKPEIWFCTSGAKVGRKEEPLSCFKEKTS